MTTMAARDAGASMWERTDLRPGRRRRGPALRRVLHPGHGVAGGARLLRSGRERRRSSRTARPSPATGALPAQHRRRPAVRRPPPRVRAHPRGLRAAAGRGRRPPGGDGPGAGRPRWPRSATAAAPSPGRSCSPAASADRPAGRSGPSGGRRVRRHTQVTGGPGGQGGQGEGGAVAGRGHEHRGVGHHHVVVGRAAGPNGSTTEVAGSVPMRTVPMLCRLSGTESRGEAGVAPSRARRSPPSTRPPSPSGWRPAAARSARRPRSSWRPGR